ncbi:hypothetical protein JFU48_29165 [Pseudomonas sp. TH49]|uniref:hypothetical protein n=1 Tax=Pseudomonas sp. TH49 TaxID=2796413 RepID=UPI0019146AA5|nr:hypothetical protein [Pseudomonas sp. TH49]MBK5345410.1 hypothetical protein [Pseudomonas sp. TH49]
MDSRLGTFELVSADSGDLEITGVPVDLSIEQIQQKLRGVQTFLGSNGGLDEDEAFDNFFVVPIKDRSGGVITIASWYEDTEISRGYGWGKKKLKEFKTWQELEAWA